MDVVGSVCAVLPDLRKKDGGGDTTYASGYAGKVTYLGRRSERKDPRAAAPPCAPRCGGSR